jgi:hypothetical protein
VLRREKIRSRWRERSDEERGAVTAIRDVARIVKVPAIQWPKGEFIRWGFTSDVFKSGIHNRDDRCHGWCGAQMSDQQTAEQ